jgi:hypothetical protein
MRVTVAISRPRRAFRVVFLRPLTLLAYQWSVPENALGDKEFVAASGRVPSQRLG